MLAQRGKDKEREVEGGEVTIVQLSDFHLGLPRAPDAEANLRKAVDMIAAMNPRPNAVIVSGDLGESAAERDKARGIVKWVKVPVYYIPGNHDDNWNTVDKWKSDFGPDYYNFKVGFVTFLAIDSQLLGNYDVYESPNPIPLPPKGQQEAEEQLEWLQGQVKELSKEHPQVVVAVQHIPNFMDAAVTHDKKPYWHTQAPWTEREVKLLREAGVRNVLCGHWHRADVFSEGGITYRVAPATSWLTFGGKLGFAVHRIHPDGRIDTEFVYLDGTSEQGR